MKKLMGLLCLLFTIVVSIPNVQAVEYRIIDLGVPTASGTTATAINNNGQVVGRYTSAGVTRGFIWESGVSRDLGYLEGGYYSDASDINDYGQVTGVSSTFGGEFHAYIWENNKMMDIGTLGGNRSIPLAINNNGQIAGYSSIEDDSMIEHAFLWQSGSPMQDIGTLGHSSEAHGINDCGQIVGITIPSSPFTSFIYQNGSMEALNFGFMGPLKINNNGQIIAGVVSDQYSGIHAALLDNGLVRDLGTLGGDYSRGMDVNNNGWVVGSSNPKGTSTTHAFLWVDGIIQDLGTLGGVSSRAYGINDNGWIVGTSTDATGATHAVLWQPVPEPSSILTLLCGIGTLGGIVLKRKK